MGRLKFLGISILILCTSVTASTILSTSKKDLERAAELAVERAAEKAAERAVEKALNSGNSSTITVTVKESYSNARKTAEEAAAPGSESTRPYDSNLYDRQYSHRSNAPDGYKVTTSEEEEEDDSTREREYDKSVESKGSEEASMENTERSINPMSSPIKTLGKGFENSDPELDFTTDFDSLDISSDASFQGNFGLKSNSKARTKTFSRSYAAEKPSFPETKVEVDDNDDAEIFQMYATRLGKTGWSSAREKGWVRHRPLWDDSKTSVDQPFWSDFRDMSTSETKFNRDKVQRSRERTYRSDQISQPTMVNVNTNKHVPPMYQILPRPAEMPAERTFSYRAQADGNPVKLYITIPVTYATPTHLFQKDLDLMTTENPKHMKKQLGERGPLPAKQVLKRSYGIENGGLFFFNDKNFYPRNNHEARVKKHIYPSIIELRPASPQFFNSKFFQSLHN